MTVKLFRKAKVSHALCNYIFFVVVPSRILKFDWLLAGVLFAVDLLFSQ